VELDEPRHAIEIGIAAQPILSRKLLRHLSSHETDSWQ
jgi:hypothetical protein